MQSGKCSFFKYCAKTFKCFPYLSATLETFTMQFIPWTVDLRCVIKVQATDGRKK